MQLRFQVLWSSSKTISVNDCPSNGFRLVKHGVTQYVASCVFFNEAFAVEVHKQEAVNMREEVSEFSHARERCSHRCERLKNLVVH